MRMRMMSSRVSSFFSDSLLTFFVSVSFPPKSERDKNQQHSHLHYHAEGSKHKHKHEHQFSSLPLPLPLTTMVCVKGRIISSVLA